MKLEPEQVRHVANLARLQLTNDEEARYGAQLSAILEAMEKLNALDTDGVEPTAHATFGETLLRADEPRPSLPPEKSLQNAPSKVGTSFAVPKILE